MERLSLPDKAIILLWILLLFVGSVTAAVSLVDLYAEAGFFSFRLDVLRKTFGLFCAAVILGYVGYDLVGGLWKGSPDMEMLQGATLLMGRMPAVMSLVLTGFVLWQGEDLTDVAYLISGGLLLGIFGFYTRRRFRDRMKIKKDPAVE